MKVRSMTLTAVIAAMGCSTVSAAPIVAITEYLYKSASGSNPRYVEITNVGDATADLSGYVLKTGPSATSNETTLASGVTLAAGESLVFAGSVTPAAFRTAWSLPSTVQVIQSTAAQNLGNTINIQLFSSAVQLDGNNEVILTNLVDSLSYGKNRVTGASNNYVGVPKADRVSVNVPIANLGNGFDRDASNNPLVVSSAAGDVYGTHVSTYGAGSLFDTGNPGSYVAAAVPEPTGLALGTIGALVMLRRKRTTA